MAILLTEEQKDKLIGLAYKKSPEIEELEKYSDLFKDNLSILARLVRINGLILKYANEEMRNNLELVNLAISKDYNAVEFVSESLKNDKTFMEKVVQINQSLFQIIKKKN